MRKLSLLLFAISFVFFSCKKIKVADIETNQLRFNNDTCFLVFPNSFTANADGRNDVFRLLGNGVSSSNFELTIRKDKGRQKIVFSSTSPNGSWDGTGEETGRYIATVKGEFVNGASFEGNQYVYYYNNCVPASDASSALFESMFDPITAQFIFPSGEANCP